MNKQWILFHLEEALEEIEKTIQEIQSEPEYDEPVFSVAIEHLYHHVNTAWNSRNSSDEETTDSNDINFNTWRQFPKDIDLSC